MWNPMVKVPANLQRYTCIQSLTAPRFKLPVKAEPGGSWDGSGDRGPAVHTVDPAQAQGFQSQLDPA